MCTVADLPADAYMETWLRTDAVRQFTKDTAWSLSTSSLKQAADGLHGTTLCGEWIASADLFPEGGVQPPPRSVELPAYGRRDDRRYREAKYYKAVFSKHHYNRLLRYLARPC